MSDPSKWTYPMLPTRPHGPPTVIHAGLMRTGTLSMARAYDTLGLRAHHGLDMGSSPFGSQQWALLERAAEGTWPCVPHARPGSTRFTRTDWDALFSTYDAVTDVASLFASQLFHAYPEAKVVIVERPFESWWPRYEHEVVGGLFHPLTAHLIALVSFLTGSRGGLAMQKMILGAFHARNVDEVRMNARTTHREYYARIREIVPAEQRLEFKLSDGWTPLCEFLGKEVPDSAFPHVNDTVEHHARMAKEVKRLLRIAWEAVRFWVLGFVSLVMAANAYWIIQK